MLVNTLPRLDMIINNACQTIRRPRSYYQHLMPNEVKPITDFAKPVQKIVGDPVHSDRGSTSALLLANSGSVGVSSNVTTTTTSVPNTTATTTTTTSGEPRLSSAAASQVVVASEDVSVDPTLFPKNAFDVNQQQIDLRRRNSWLLRLGEIETGEVAEVFAINSIAPFVINSHLKPLLLKRGSTTAQQQTHPSKTKKSDNDRFIINVSAMEGKFYRFKSPNHPHTNMAKAALNMMTRTSASDYAQDGIYMNAVDTGWINDENPLEKAEKIAGIFCVFAGIDGVGKFFRMLTDSLMFFMNRLLPIARHNFQTPIDEIDAAARILDPIMVGLNTGKYGFGKFYKDYKETEW